MNRPTIVDQIKKGANLTGDIKRVSNDDYAADD